MRALLAALLLLTTGAAEARAEGLSTGRVFGDISHARVAGQPIGGVLPSAPIRNSLVHRVPGPGDDSAHGEPVGSFWLADDVLYQSVLDTPGNALWSRSISQSPYPATAISWSDAYGTRRLSQAYTAGKLFDLTRVSDSTVLTVSTINDRADTASADAFCSGTTCRYTMLYDQVGSTNLPIPIAGAPEYKPGIMTGNSPSIIMDTDIFGAGLSPGQPSETIPIPASITTNAAAVTWGFVSRNTSGGLDIPLLDLYANGSYDTWFSCNGATPNRGLYVGYINTAISSDMNCPISAAFTGFTMSGTGSILFKDGRQISGTQGGYAGFTYAGGQIGGGREAGTQGSGNTEIAAIFFRAAASSAADLSAAEAAVSLGFQIPPQKAGVEINNGDSIIAGVGASDLQTGPRQIDNALDQPVEVVSSGYSGATRASLVANLPGWATNNFDPNARTNIWLGESGTNDLSGTVAPANQAVTIEALARQESAIVRGIGFRYVACTLIPRTGFTAAQEAQRQAYNAYVRANWPRYADALDDRDANVEIRTRMSDPLFSPEGTHLTSRGYLAVAATDAASLNSMLIH